MNPRRRRLCRQRRKERVRALAATTEEDMTAFLRRTRLNQRLADQAKRKAERKPYEKPAVSPPIAAPALRSGALLRHVLSGKG